MKEDGPAINHTFNMIVHNIEYEERCEDLKPRRSSPSLE